MAVFIHNCLWTKRLSYLRNAYNKELCRGYGFKASANGNKQSVKVTFLPENVSVWANPGESLYAVAERGGVELLYDCSVGDCGACEVEVLSGKNTQQTSSQKRLFIRPCVAKVPSHKTELFLHTVGTDIPPW
eukprot:jgi/Galph1/336/GphlegSOOS_G5060.1